MRATFQTHTPRTALIMQDQQEIWKQKGDESAHDSSQIGIGERSFDHMLVENDSLATITPDIAPRVAVRGQTPPIKHVAVFQAPVAESQPASTPSFEPKTKAAEVQQ